MSRTMTARFEFKCQDCWIGAYWEHTWNGGDWREHGYDKAYRTTDLWLCFFPMLPLHITIRRRPNDPEAWTDMARSRLIEVLPPEKRPNDAVAESEGEKA